MITDTLTFLYTTFFSYIRPQQHCEDNFRLALIQLTLEHILFGIDVCSSLAGDSNPV